MKIARWIGATLHLVLKLAAALLRLPSALLGAGWRSYKIGHDFVQARRALRGGVLHCPVGHEVATEGGVYECECGFVYGGASASIWKCGNPECGAITPDVRCGTCGLSCRNPYRWG